jgi:hypothetical protein
MRLNPILARSLAALGISALVSIFGVMTAPAETLRRLLVLSISSEAGYSLDRRQADSS